LKKFYRPPGTSLNLVVRENFRVINELLHQWDSPVILNLGGGDRFSGSEELDTAFLRNVTNLDIARKRSVTVLGNAHHLPFSDACFECIICQGVLEHVQNPALVVQEAERVLKQSGIFYAEVPFMQGFHASPHDYQRYTQEGLKELLRGFEPVRTGVCVGPSSALSWMLRQYIAGVLTGFSLGGRKRGLALTLAGWLTFPIKYLDHLFADKPFASYMASGFFHLGRKNSNKRAEGP
jgi:SAM-dependent methyltransferase